MTENETLARQVAALTNLRTTCREFDNSLKFSGDVDPLKASEALTSLLKAVEELKDTARPQPYIPVVGESVTIQGTVEEVNIGYSKTVQVRFGEGTYDYHAVDPTIVPVRPA